ncbi:MAG: hypothetical protein V4739_17450 [Pseudomonadota bacterium]
MKRLTLPPRAPSRSRRDGNPLEEAWESARDARDIIRDVQRRDARALSAYTSDETEDTARHEAPAPQFHNHFHMPSQPDRDTAPQIELGPFKARGLPKWLVAVFAGIVAAATAIVAHFARK